MYGDKVVIKGFGVPIHYAKNWFRGWFVRVI